MFTAKVYRIMVGSLSGAMEEVYVAKETIRKWNQQNAERTGKVFMPVEWSTAPEAIQNVDVVVGIVDNWIEKPLIVEECLRAGKLVMLFFNAIHDSNNTIPTELQEVLLFKNMNHGQCYCADYNEPTELCNLLSNQLSSIKQD